MEATFICCDMYQYKTERVGQLKKELLRIQADTGAASAEIDSNVRMLKENVGRKEEEFFWTGMKRKSEEVLDNLQKTVCKCDHVAVYQKRLQDWEDQEKGTKGHAENPAKTMEVSSSSSIINSWCKGGGHSSWQSQAYAKTKAASTSACVQPHTMCYEKADMRLKLIQIWVAH